MRKDLSNLLNLGDNEIVKVRKKEKYKRKSGVIDNILVHMAGAPNL